MYRPRFIDLCDFYKVDHRRQYPAKTQRVYSNFTARASRVEDQSRVVFFGLQYFLKHYLTDLANETFFEQPRGKVVGEYQRQLDGGLGPNDIGTEHIAALHRYGRIPLRFDALPEGTAVPLRVPMFTVENTHPDFFWLTNYIETVLSCVIWGACTSATTAWRFRQMLDSAARRTGGDPNFVPWQAHDFSFRGMFATEAALISAAAHLLSFTGTDMFAVIPFLKEFYAADDRDGPIGGSVPATEHSVMCAGSQECEFDTFDRLLKLYPTGIVSVVSDTWDFWNVVTDILPALKDRIMARDGKLVIRPDSGDPVKILCGDPSYPIATPQYRGLIECLWSIFGGTRTSTNHCLLDPHIGAIYGDSINYARGTEICQRLEAKGFASTNDVLGVGSYTYNYVTRDTYGHAIKATWAQIDGEERMLFKAPKTDDGTKNSARGRLAVVADASAPSGLSLIDGLNLLSQRDLGELNLLQPTWSEGYFIQRHTLTDIRARLRRQ